MVSQVNSPQGREAKEELGPGVFVGPLVAGVWHEGRLQRFFLCSITGGVFGSGRGPEVTGRYPPVSGTHRPVWVPIAGLRGIDLRLSELTHAIVMSQTRRWPGGALDFGLGRRQGSWVLTHLSSPRYCGPEPAARAGMVKDSIALSQRVTAPG